MTCKEKENHLGIVQSGYIQLAKLTHPTHSRPPLEDSYPQLYGAIVDKAAAGAGSDFRRGTDVLNT